MYRLISFLSKPVKRLIRPVTVNLLILPFLLVKKNRIDLSRHVITFSVVFSYQILGSLTDLDQI